MSCTGEYENGAFQYCISPGNTSGFLHRIALAIEAPSSVKSHSHEGNEGM